jgi:hypothetical protein
MMLTMFANTIVPIFGDYIYVGGGLLTLAVVVLFVLFVARPHLSVHIAEIGFWTIKSAVAVPSVRTLGTTRQSRWLGRCEPCSRRT